MNLPRFVSIDIAYKGEAKEVCQGRVRQIFYKNTTRKICRRGDFS